MTPKGFAKSLKLGLPKTKTPSTKIYFPKRKWQFVFCYLSITKNCKELFSNLAQNVIEKLSTGPNKFDINSEREFYKPLNLEEIPFHFTKIYENTISYFLKEVRTIRPTGNDNLSSWILKGRSKVLATLVVQICNLSIKLFMISDESRIAKLKPPYKNGEKTDLRNYRPISLLRVISEILEKVIHDQTMDFVTKKRFHTYFNHVFENSALQILASRIYKER